MRRLPRYHHLFLFIGCLCLILFASCKKEHSCEGCHPPPIPSPVDTLLPSSPDTSLPPVFLPPCALCREGEESASQSWDFKTGSTYLCGGITEALFIGDHSTFTLLGTSSCSADTSLRMTVYLTEPLDGDKAGITTNNVAFYYYDNVALKSILISGASQAFFVTISSYVAATQTASGTFGGTVFTSDGGVASVKGGRFNVQLK